MLAEHVIHLSQTYRHLGRAWNQDELAARYAAANRRGEQSRTGTPDTVPERPIALLATAIPSAATLSVAIHLLHALPDSVPDKLRASFSTPPRPTRPMPFSAATGRSSSTATRTATPPTSGSPSSKTSRARCSSPRGWTRSHRR
jgi:hypothetical protein